jgi:hypothetical protein
MIGTCCRCCGLARSLTVAAQGRGGAMRKDDRRKRLSHQGKSSTCRPGGAGGCQQLFAQENK